MMGLPHGQLDVKYHVDHDLEAQIDERLFPAESSRPKISELARRIEQYKEADETFKELWMLFVVSTIVAPTTDIRMSNRCYPMLVSACSIFSLFHSLVPCSFLIFFKLFC
jgi:hypothetical protein